MLVSAGQSLIFLTIAYLIRYSFDVAVPAGDTYQLMLIGLGFLLLIGVNLGISLWTNRYTRKITTQVIYDLRNDLLNKCFSIPRSYYSETDQSRIHTSIVQDTQRLDLMNNTLVSRALPSLLIVLGLIIVMIYLNWILFIILVFTFAPMFYLSRLSKKSIQDEVNIYHRTLEDLSKGNLFILQTMDLIRIQAAEELEIQQQRGRHEEMRLRSYVLVWITAIYTSMMDGIISFSGIIILVVGGITVSMGLMTIGELISFYIVVSFLRNHLRNVMMVYPVVIEGDESLSTLYGILNIEETHPYHGTRQIPFEGGITLESVSFKYTDKQILHDVNLSIKAGNLVVIMGPNGAGKSTIAHLILGFYRPQDGKIWADNYFYDDLDITNLRKHFGVIQQDPVLFSGTVWENITYGQSKPDIDQVDWACQMATALEFVRKLPEGYNTLVGEKGVRLSGGQRQRIAIARALARNPKLLLLDEPTNNLDEESIEQVISNLRSLKYSPSILIISHDINIARSSDHIYLLDRGVVTREGNFYSLFETDQAPFKQPLD
jgi:ATP-binding cassette subfamily B protein